MAGNRRARRRSDIFGFIALMARNSVLSWHDFEEAAAVCTELGLGDLIHRVPAGISQIVGDTG
jgi:ATP-binding cassette subfamily B protein